MILKETLYVLGLMGSLSMTYANETNWWDDSAWLDPDRPFLYYNIEQPPQRKDEKVAPPETVKTPTRKEQETKKVMSAPAATSLTPNKEEPPVAITDLSSIKTVSALKAERVKRLERAIMVPSAENLKAVREIDAYMLGLAHRYTDAWNLSRVDAPEYDWSVKHPTSAFAIQHEKSQVALAQERFLRWLLPQMELILVTDPKAMSFPSFVQLFKLVKGTFGVRTQLILSGTSVDPMLLKHMQQRFKDKEVFESVNVDRKNIAKALAGHITPAVIFIPHEKAEERLVDYLAWRQSQRGHSVLTYTPCAASTLEQRMLAFFEEVMDPKANYKPKAWEVMKPEDAKQSSPAPKAVVPQTTHKTSTECPSGLCGLGYQSRHQYLNQLSEL